ncbi:unnamed protein product [Phytomonas sp. Hart1]|nr:unnamed protein product [Phytomonas sp. Hart1]|eukprot:CCW67244.1 unnamed protein product [Phytomonas sp. isolate Hart1]
MCFKYLRKRERANQDLAGEQSFDSESEKPHGSSVELDKIQSPVASPSTLMFSLFSTASGKSIQINEAALQKARIRYNLGEEENIISNNDINNSDEKDQKACESRSDNAIAERNVPAGEETALSSNIDVSAGEGSPRSSLPEASVSNNLSISDKYPSPESEKPPHDSNKSDKATPNEDKETIHRTPANTAVRRPTRKGFVPPRILSNPPPSVLRSNPLEEKAEPNTKETTADPAKKEKAKTSGFLSFPYRALTSTAPLDLPTVEDIAEGRFHFTRAECGEALRDVFGFPDPGARDERNPKAANPENPKSTESAVHPARWRRLLVSLGAHAPSCTEVVCGEMVRAAMLQVRDIFCKSSGRWPTPPSSPAAAPLFTPTSTAMCVCLRYNREFVEGDRPLFRKITEGDVSAAVLGVVTVVAISHERDTPHTRLIRVSDGFYHLQAALDVPLNRLVREGGLSVGRKIAVCGARCLLRAPCPPTDCLGEVVLRYNYNCVRPVSAESKVGFCLFEPLALGIGEVHPHGGLVPALEGVVVRVLPPFFVNQSHLSTGGGNARERHARFANPTPPSAHSIKTIRNFTSQLRYEHSLSTQHEDGGGEGAARIKVSCVASILLRCEGGDALIQHWKEIPEPERGSSHTTEGDEEAYYSQLPVEGSAVVVYGVNPSRSQTAGPPFPHAKLFYASRALHYQPRPSPNLPPSDGRPTYASLNPGEEPFKMGGVVDLAGVFVGAQKTMQGTFYLFLLSDGKYAILQVPLPSPTRAIALEVPAKAEGGGFIVMNSTFICYEDPKCGSDCARLFANEYTLCTQRASSPAAKAAMAALSAQAKAFERGDVKYAARRAEIFRSASEAPSAGHADHPYPAPAPHPNDKDRPLINHSHPNEEETMALAQNLMSFHPVEPLHSLTAVAANGKRVPYYLRENHPAKAGLNGGVVFPKPTIEAAKSTPASLSTSSTSQENKNPKNYYHWYGNLIEMAFVRTAIPMPSSLSSAHRVEDGEAVIIFSETQRDLSPSGALLRPEIANPPPSRQASRVCRVKWRYGSSGEVGKGEIRDPAVLDSLLEPCISAQTLITTSVDIRQIEFSIPRTELLNRWRSSTGFWWRLLTQSRVLEGPDSAERPAEDENECALWLASEWRIAQKLIKDALNGVLFKFTVRENVMERVFYVTNNCFVSQMFCDS